MKYTLYVTDNCPGCEEVLSGLPTIDADVSVINIAEKSENDARFIFIIPALYAEKKPVAYGPNILEYFKKQKATG